MFLTLKLSIDDKYWYNFKRIDIPFELPVYDADTTCLSYSLAWFSFLKTKQHFRISSYANVKCRFEV